MLEKNLLIVTPLSSETDDGLLVLAREVTGSAGLFVGDKVSISRRNHDVRERGVGRGRLSTGSSYIPLASSGDCDGGSDVVPINRGPPILQGGGVPAIRSIDVQFA